MILKSRCCPQNRPSHILKEKIQLLAPFYKKFFWFATEVAGAGLCNSSLAKLKRLNHGLQFFRCNQSPGLAQVKIQFFVTDVIQLEANSAAATDIRRFEEFLRRRSDQHLLDNRSAPAATRRCARRCDGCWQTWQRLFVDEEGGLAVREFFRRLRQRGTNAPDSSHVNDYLTFS